MVLISIISAGFGLAVKIIIIVGWLYKPVVKIKKQKSPAKPIKSIEHQPLVDLDTSILASIS